ncbi:MAG: PfkB family carbohydrate kinase [Candidatus Poribacteria bacterium]|jgi:sugar/nucleoside kinase (ribokinase family)|nr:PfkB family carbohydrate kinase [Candidatus Poribacteria bacterium]MDP6748917.1 PfkB family carbohydrate kinase [Candidatus Poribacteria bacterium]MDP6997218.1 PfkB family carbohydrate kinase [Candidatus Poribacteria bacterium]
MGVLVVGSVALDTVETLEGKVEDSLGGSATYFSVAASFFHQQIHLVGVVGDDFPSEHVDFLSKRGIDLQGLEQITGGKTFRWGGSYVSDLNAAETEFTDLNVFSDFDPRLPDTYQDTPYVFLANINPELQLRVLEQVYHPKLVVCDTMNLWIDISRPALMETLKQVDILILNDGEAKQLTEKKNLIQAGKEILTYGPSRVVIKKGEHGAISLTESEFFAVPAYPLTSVFDPTGAGDSFAGGFMGYLAAQNQSNDEQTIRQAIVYGTVVASFNVEDFSLNRQRTLTRQEIDDRFNRLKGIAHF